MQTKIEVRTALLTMLAQEFNQADPVDFAMGRNLTAKQIARATIAVDKIGEQPPQKEVKLFNVVLNDYGGNKLDCVKIVRAYSGLSLMDAKRKVEGYGVMFTGPLKDANKMLAELSKFYAVAEVVPHSPGDRSILVD